ncbi:Concanavalin A-like lectin/glucanases superfamily [uncultured Caudovirales phage]|uniref:Concanavalin A-like lectin/glucanases superfamily n=1 Tax=uncultured Caudovirales phage TaxID=2100421 RepID=A0A6J7WYS2_9CAUD|nr:Concanavalin A-like lectin/glucanases superfamily [uncultured Caudovirales phage]CAB5222055.1 Concanavalin A-like lectin/glucanases superfamily [uncultured Caudovirales phage]
MSVLQNTTLFAGDDGYQISRSVRLRSSASATFSRTTGTATSATTWTWSAWVKRGTLGSIQAMFSGGSSGSVSGATTSMIAFDSGDVITLYFSGGSSQLNTTAVFRDPSAWYHIVVKVAATTATIYVNGVQSATGSVTPTYINANSTIQYFGYQNYSGSTRYFDGYMAEVNFIDGQALTPASFGESDALTGVWKPKKYAGTYGTNGFYLNFSDNSAATAAAIGKDNSGNGNNWTPNNISVTTGATYDSMLDVPTMYADGGNGRGNYATLNPLQCHPYVTLSSGNLTLAGNNAAGSGISLATQSFSSGLYYWEYIQAGTASEYMGVMTYPITGQNLQGTALETSYGIGARYNGNVYGIAGEVQTPAAFSWTTGDVIGIAVDANNGAVYYSKNGTWLNSGVPTSGASRTGSFFNYTPSSLRIITPFLESYTGGGASINFGQRPFAYTPPTGFKALNTQNLPDATIKKGNAYFDATTYTGTGAAQSITNSGAFQPDLVWAKIRSGVSSHALYDSVRGVRTGLFSNLTNAENTEAAGVSLTAFNSNGFSLGTDNVGSGSVNLNAATYAAWQWKKGATQGFDIVTFTAPASGNFTVNHSLGVAPAMVIVKNRTGGTASWYTWHKSFSNALKSYMYLDGTAAVDNTTYNMWGAAGHNSSTLGFTVGTSTLANANEVAYLFAEVAGYSKFGSYTGNGSTDGPFVYCGFRPRYILIKRTTGLGNWHISDTSRDTYNVAQNALWANLSDAESSGANQYIDILSNGFKIRNATGEMNNGSSDTYIYAAFAENPFKNSLAR